VGLAAPQVGVNVRLMVFNEAGERGKGEEMVLANPRIISSGRKGWTEQEGCLSFVRGKEQVLGDVEVRPAAHALWCVAAAWGQLVLTLSLTVSAPGKDGTAQSRPLLVMYCLRAGARLCWDISHFDICAGFNLYRMDRAQHAYCRRTIGARPIATTSWRMRLACRSAPCSGG
jgi:hypothetical protein